MKFILTSPLMERESCRGPPSRPTVPCGFLVERFRGVASQTGNLDLAGVASPPPWKRPFLGPRRGGLEIGEFAKNCPFFGGPSFYQTRWLPRVSSSRGKIHRGSGKNAEVAFDPFSPPSEIYTGTPNLGPPRGGPKMGEFRGIM